MPLTMSLATVLGNSHKCLGLPKKSITASGSTCEKCKQSCHFVAVFLILCLQLLADQNLKFIDPFCKIAAKTKE
jgi:hypothetical protein